MNISKEMHLILDDLYQIIVIIDIHTTKRQLAFEGWLIIHC